MTTDLDRARRLADHLDERRSLGAKLTAESVRVAARAIRVYLDLLEQPKSDRALNSNYIILLEGRNGVTEEVMALASNGSVADAAYAAACQQRPDGHVVLKQGIRLIRERKPGAQGEPLA